MQLASSGIYSHHARLKLDTTLSHLQPCNAYYDLPLDSSAPYNVFSIAYHLVLRIRFFLERHLRGLYVTGIGPALDNLQAITRLD